MSENETMNETMNENNDKHTVENPEAQGRATYTMPVDQTELAKWLGIQFREEGLVYEVRCLDGIEKNNWPAKEKFGYFSSLEKMQSAIAEAAQHQPRGEDDVEDPQNFGYAGVRHDGLVAGPGIHER